MSKTKIIISAIASLCIASQCPGRGTSVSTADLLYGQRTSVSLRNVHINYDGKNTVILSTKSRQIQIAANAPAQISVSPNSRYVVYDFGRDSGQIYNIEVHDLMRGGMDRLNYFKRRVIKFGRSRPSCYVKYDEVSYLFTKWLGEAAFQVRTEDWTRRPGCGHLNRSWRIDLRRMAL